MFILLVAVVLNVYLLIIVPKGFFPDDRRRPHQGRHPRRPDHLLPVDAEEIHPVHGHRPRRSGGGGNRRLDGAAVAARGGGSTNSGNLFITLKPPAAARLCDHRGGDRTAAAQAGSDRRRARLHAAGQRHRRARRRPPGQRHTSSTPSRPTRWTISTNGCPRSPTRCRTCRNWRTSIPTGRHNGLEMDLKIDRADRVAAGPDRQPDRQHAVRCLRPAPGLDHLQGQEPVSCDHGSGAGLLAEPRNPARYLCLDLGQHHRHPGHRRAAPPFATAAPRPASGAAGGPPRCRRGRGRCGAQPAAQCPDQHRPGGGSTSAAVSTRVETMVPLSAFASYGPGATPLSVNHQGAFVATTFSFSLPDGVTLRPGDRRPSTAPWRRSMCRSRCMATPPAPLQLVQKSLGNLPHAVAGGDRHDLHRAGHAL